MHRMEAYMYYWQLGKRQHVSCTNAHPLGWIVIAICHSGCVLQIQEETVRVFGGTALASSEEARSINTLARLLQVK